MAIYFQILWHRLYVVIIVTVISTAVAGYATTKMQPTYRTEALLLVAPFGLGEPDLATYRYSEQLSTTFSLILNSYSVEVELKELLGEDQASDNYNVSLIPNSELLQITVTDTNPLYAQKTANALADILLERLRSGYGVNLENIEGTLSARLDEIQVEIQDLIAERAELSNQDVVDNVRLAEIESLIEVNTQSLTTVLASYNQALVDQATQDSLISIFEEATVPENPSGPRMKLNLVAGMFVGGFGSILIIFFLELIHPRAYTDDQIEGILDGKIIGHIPKIKRPFRDNVFARQPIFLDDSKKLTKKHNSSDLVAREAFRRLRTKINNAFSEERQKKLLFVSANPNDGKSTVALNSALAIAQNFNRVLLIDCDIYESDIPSRLGIENKVGLAEVLSEQTPISEAVQNTVDPNFDVITSGNASIVSSELLGSLNMQVFLEEVSDTYDYVILDSAPLLITSDTSSILPFVNGIIFVTETKAAVNELRMARAELVTDHLCMFGVVINRVSHGTLARVVGSYLG